LEEEGGLIDQGYSPESVFKGAFVGKMVLVERKKRRGGGAVGQLRQENPGEKARGESPEGGGDVIGDLEITTDKNEDSTKRGQRVHPTRKNQK